MAQISDSVQVRRATRGETTTAVQPSPVTVAPPAAGDAVDGRPAIALSDPDGALIAVNDVLLRMWGYHVPGDLVGRPISTLWENYLSSTFWFELPG